MLGCALVSLRLLANESLTPRRSVFLHTKIVLPALWTPRTAVACDSCIQLIVAQHNLTVDVRDVLFTAELICTKTDCRISDESSWFSSQGSQN